MALRIEGYIWNLSVNPVHVALPAAVKKVDRILLHPGMPLVASVLTVMGDS